MRKQWLLVLLVLFAKSAFAQTIRGTVVGPDDRPITGVLVILVDAGSKEVGRALTDEQGAYRLTAPRPGTYRVRTLRIGFQSVRTEPIALAASDDVTRRLAVSTLVFSLDTVRAVGRNQCRVLAEDSTSVVGAIWDQVRSALFATQVSLSRRTIYTTNITYERVMEVRSQRIGRQTLDVKSGFVAQPWRSASAATLRKTGYVYTQEDSSRIYHAPDLMVLLSEEFIEDHCLRIAQGSTDQRLGIDFTPTPARRNTPEIRGTLWLDRKTNELVEMEYGYINRIRLDEERLAGGGIGFTHMKNGMWAISRWTIRMPMPTLVAAYSPTLARMTPQLRLDSLKVSGGELVMVTTTGMRRDTIWMRPGVALRGIVVDSLSDAPVRRAVVSLAGTIQVDTTDDAGRFVIGGVLPGRYGLNVTTPSLDSVGTVDQRNILFADSSRSLTVRVPNASMIAGSVCGRNNTATRLGSGILLGSVVRGRDSTPVANANISAEWTEVVVGGALGFGSRVREAQTRTDARGVFRICGMPTTTTFTVYAKTDSGTAPPMTAKLVEDQLFARVDLVMDGPPAKTSTFAGIVVDSAGKPLPDAEILVTDLAMSTTAGSDGKFKLDGVSPGNRAVTVRKLGFGPMDAKVDFVEGRSTERRIVLTRITLLDSIVSKGAGRDPLMETFEERRRLGLGHFVTNVEIVKREGMLLSSFLGQMPSLNVLASKGYEWIEGKRATHSSCTSGTGVPRKVERNSQLGRCLMREGIYYVPPEGETVPVGCYSRVYLDHQLMNPGQPSPPVSLRDLPAPTSIEAIEWYASATQMPVEFFARNSSCGVIVIHTRRPK